MKNKVVIVGCGNVGMSYAYALLNQNTKVNELVLIDIDKERALGEAMDLNHGISFAPGRMIIKAGDYSECKDASIVCLAAGANQKPGETRMDLINKNSVIFKSIVSEVMKSGFNGIFLVATNPLDVMTHLTWKYSGLPHSKVIGSGTSLDTSRLRFMIGDKLNISPKSVHAYIIGEHEDSEFAPFSNATIGLQDIHRFLNDEELNEIYLNVKNAAYEIINRKGATCYGIGMCLVRITNAILNNENSIITVSSYDPENNIYMGIPSIVNRDGVRERVYVELTEEETAKLQNCVDIIKEAINSVENN